MTTALRVKRLVSGLGFVPFDDAGFVSFRRHANDTVQVVKFFFWTNPRHADAIGIPRHYVVIALDLDSATGRGESDGRFALIVEGRRGEGKREWRDVVDEFYEVFVPILESPVAVGRALLAEIEDTHSLNSVSTPKGL